MKACLICGAPLTGLVPKLYCLSCRPKAEQWRLARLEWEAKAAAALAAKRPRPQP